MHDLRRSSSAGCKELDISLMKRSEGRSMPDPSIQNPPRREEKRNKKKGEKAKRSTDEKLYRARSTEQYVPRSGIVAAFKPDARPVRFWRIYRAIKGIKSSPVKFRTGVGSVSRRRTIQPRNRRNVSNPIGRDQLGQMGLTRRADNSRAAT